MSRSRAFSPRKRPVQARARATVEAILEGAAQVFARMGTARATTNRIAERAGVSVGSLYQYFPSKESILVALLERHVEEGTRAAMALLERADAPAPPLDTMVRTLVERLLALHAERPELHRILFREAPRAESVQAALGRIQARARADVARLLRDHPEVRVRDPEATAWVLVHTVLAVTHEWAAEPPSVLDQAAVVDELTALVTARLRER